MENLDLTFDHAIAVNLKRLRTAGGFTLDGLAEASGVSRAMISRIERAELQLEAPSIDRQSQELVVQKR